MSTPARARAVLSRLLRGVAPDVDLADVDDDALLHDELGLDSMDVLHLLAALAETEGVDVPERDYPALATVGGFVAYLAARLA